MTKFKSQGIDKNSLVHQSYDLIYETSISPTIVERKAREPRYRTIPAWNVILRAPLSRGYGSFPLQFTPVNSRFHFPLAFSDQLLHLANIIGRYY